MRFAVGSTFLVTYALVASSFVGAAQQAPSSIDLDRKGPQVGAPVPPFSGVDQQGRTQTLESVMKPDGVMLVFFRSADW